MEIGLFSWSKVNLGLLAWDCLPHQLLTCLTRRSTGTSCCSKLSAKRTHCVKSFQIRSFSGLNTRKYGPEKTLYMDSLRAVRFSVLR